MTSSAAAPADPVLLRQERDGVARLTLNRPRQANALSGELLGELRTALDALARDDACRVVVIAGNGPAFCAGHDLREMREAPQLDAHRSLFARCSQVMQRLTALPKPVVARVHGVATAAGCQLVASCDLVVASSSARFATSGIDLGLFCSTPAVALSRAVLPRHALEMLMTGSFIDAERAVAIGLVNRVVAPDSLDAEVDGLAAQLAAKSPVALRAGKEMFYRQLGLPLAEAYAFAGEVMAQNMMAPDACQGFDAFLARRSRGGGGR